MFTLSHIFNSHLTWACSGHVSWTVKTHDMDADNRSEHLKQGLSWKFELRDPRYLLSITDTRVQSHSLNL